MNRLFAEFVAGDGRERNDVALYIATISGDRRSVRVRYDDLGDEVLRPAAVHLRRHGDIDGVASRWRVVADGHYLISVVIFGNRR